ncbi:hypothetical protein [Micromonospora sp. NPDC047527]|uniref:hypothetical protein n=1 Tax=Micromonospora sp. NPDC047527 TaxID=3155144 RepID=UPI0033ED5ED6
MLVAEAPKITDWMQAWGSIAGVVMSTAAVFFTGLLFRHEVRARRREQQDAEAAQARLVVPRIVDYAAGTGGSDEPRMIEKVKWEVINYSDAPIFSVRVRITYQDVFSIRLSQTFAVVKESCSGVVEVSRPVGVDELKGFGVTATFVDCNGKTWRRADQTLPERTVLKPNPRSTDVESSPQYSDAYRNHRTRPDGGGGFYVFVAVIILGLLTLVSFTTYLALAT